MTFSALPPMGFARLTRNRRNVQQFEGSPAGSARQEHLSDRDYV